MRRLEHNIFICAQLHTVSILVVSVVTSRVRMRKTSQEGGEGGYFDLSGALELRIDELSALSRSPAVQQSVLLSTRKARNSLTREGGGKRCGSNTARCGPIDHLSR